MKLSLFFNLAFSLKSEIITSLHNQLVGILSDKLSRGDFLKIEKSQLDSMLFIELKRDRIEISSCQQSFGTLIDLLSENDRVDDDTLMDIFNNAKSINQPAFYIYCSDFSDNLLSNLDFRNDLITRLNDISKENSGPEFFFGSCVKNYKIFKEVLKDGSNFIGDSRCTRSDYQNYKVKFTTNEKTYYVCNLDYDMFDHISMSKKYLGSIYNENLEPIWNFLSNFNIDLLFKTDILEFYDEWSCDYFITYKDKVYSGIYDNEDKGISPNPFDKVSPSFISNIKNFVRNKNLSQRDKRKLLFDSKWHAEYIELISRLNGNEKENIEKMLLTVYSLSKKRIFRTLIRRLLDSDLTPMKVLFLDLLEKLNVCDRSIINWFLFKTMKVNVDDNLSIHHEKIESVETGWYPLRNALYDFYFNIIVDGIRRCLHSLSFYFMDHNRIKAKISMLIYMKLVEHWEICEKSQNIQFKLYSDFSKNKDALYNILEIKSEEEQIDVKKASGNSIRILPFSLVLHKVFKKILDWKIGRAHYEEFAHKVIAQLCRIFSEQTKDAYDVKEQLNRIFEVKLNEGLLDGKLEVIDKIPLEQTN